MQAMRDRVVIERMDGCRRLQVLALPRPRGEATMGDETEDQPVKSGGLPQDWQPPHYKLFSGAWDNHPEHERLVEEQRERDKDGMPRWEPVLEPDPDLSSADEPWTRARWSPLDPRDPRPSTIIVRYPQWKVDERHADDRAIADEHADD
jgi:hypothetical protein